MSDARHRFGSYVLGPRLGVGGMAAAYEALRHGPGGFEQKVCLKRVLPVYRDDPDFRRLFMREAKIAASLRHSNIVGVIDFGEVDGEPYLALELIDGLDLRTVTRAQDGRRLPVDEVLLVAIELARALEYAHNVRHPGGTGVLHRDISPSNVLVSVSGEVKLGDFGIAKLMGSAGATASAAVRGKLSYLAPETAEGDAVDVRADIFALGVMLYELCHGHRPFDGSNDSQTFAAIQTGEARPWELEAGPPGLEALVYSMIARDPNARPKSAEALLEALTNVRKALPDYGDLGPRRALGARVRARIATRTTESEERRTEALRMDDPGQAPTAAPAAHARRAGADEPTKTQLASASAETVEPHAAHTDTHDRATHLLDTVVNTAESSSNFQRWLWPALVAAALLLVGSLFAFTGSEDTPLATQQTEHSPLITATTPMSNAPTTRAKARNEAPASNTRDAGEAPDASQDAQRELPAEGRVHVTVVPWGNIWIDGTRRGRAPRWVTLKPGAHRIAGGRAAIEKTRNVRVRGGKSRRVIIDLGAP